MRTAWPPAPGLENGDESEHFLFDTDRIAVRWKLRNDAKPLLRGPYVQSDGGAASGSKVSWCSVPGEATIEKGGEYVLDQSVHGCIRFP